MPSTITSANIDRVGTTMDAGSPSALLRLLASPALAPFWLALYVGLVSVAGVNRFVVLGALGAIWAASALADIIFLVGIAACWVIGLTLARRGAAGALLGLVIVFSLAAATFLMSFNLGYAAEQRGPEVPDLFWLPVIVGMPGLVLAGVAPILFQNFVTGRTRPPN